MATTPAAATANKAELLAIADSVAREKLIDKGIVIEAMEDAIQRAARARYGAENEIRAKLDPVTGDLRLWRVLEVVEEGRTPLRLPLGPDTWTDVRADLLARLAEHDAQREIALSTSA